MAAIRILASALCLAASCATAFADDPLPRAKPEDVGLSSERLARIGEVLKADIDAGRMFMNKVLRVRAALAAPSTPEPSGLHETGRCDPTTCRLCAAEVAVSEGRCPECGALAHREMLSKLAAPL